MRTDIHFVSDHNAEVSVSLGNLWYERKKGRSRAAFPPVAGRIETSIVIVIASTSILPSPREREIRTCLYSLVSSADATEKNRKKGRIDPVVPGHWPARYLCGAEAIKGGFVGFGPLVVKADRSPTKRYVVEKAIAL